MYGYFVKKSLRHPPRPWYRISMFGWSFRCFGNEWIRSKSILKDGYWDFFEAAMFVPLISFPDTLMNGVFTHIWFRYTIHWASGLYRCSQPLWNMARLGMYVTFEGCTGISSGNYPESYVNWVHPGWRYVFYCDFFGWFGNTIWFVWGTCNPRYLHWADPSRKSYRSEN